MKTLETKMHLITEWKKNTK